MTSFCQLLSDFHGKAVLSSRVDAAVCHTLVSHTGICFESFVHSIFAILIVPYSLIFLFLCEKKFHASSCVGA